MSTSYKSDLESVKVELPKSLNPDEHRFSARLGDDTTFVTVTDFMNDVFIHIRKYETNKNGQLFPTTKGAALIPCRWNEFLGLIDIIEESIKKYRAYDYETYTKHLGGNWYVSVSKKIARVDIRRFWLPEGANDIKPTRKGISLTFKQFSELLRILDEINSYVPELSDVISCIEREDHQNQIGALQCQECNPNDYQNW